LGRHEHTAVTRIENNTMLEAQHQSINFVPPQDAIGADWSAGIVAHNQIREGFPISVSLGQNAARIPGYGWYTAYTTLAPQPGPRRVELVWFQFAQPGWDQQQVPLDLSQVLSIGFALESLADTFNYSITNLRLLPAGGTGDAGAVPVSGPAWTFTCASGSPCSWSASGPSTWGVSGTNAFFGSNNLTAPLPANLQNFSAYRGLAFDLSGTAIRTYRFQGFQDVDNGPKPSPAEGPACPRPWARTRPPPRPRAERGRNRGYPSRSDLAGSMESARHIGTKLASMATATSATGAIEKLTGSCSGTP